MAYNHDGVFNDLWAHGATATATDLILTHSAGEYETAEMHSHI